MPKSNKPFPKTHGKMMTKSMYWKWWKHFYGPEMEYHHEACPTDSEFDEFYDDYKTRWKLNHKKHKR